MEHITNLCAMRELYMALNDVEEQLEEATGLTLHQALILCCISGDKIASTAIARALHLRAPIVSKHLSLLEQAGLITRHLGQEDKRQMFFTLSPQGEQKLTQLRHLHLDLPDSLLPLFEAMQHKVWA